MHYTLSMGTATSLSVRPVSTGRVRLVCVFFAILASASAGAASEQAGEGKSRWSTTVGSLTIGAGGETATFTDVRSTCNAFRLALAFGSAAADVRRCLPATEKRSVYLEVENGRVTSSTVDPDDDMGRCVLTALGGAQLGGLTCVLEAGVRIPTDPGMGEAPGSSSELTIGSFEATHSNGSKYRFPLVEGESRAAARINTFLQAVELHKLPGRYEKTAFEDVWPDEGSRHGLTGIDYTTNFNQPGILSVEIVSDYVGAYPTSNLRTYYFDARTGEVITLRSLFSVKGLAKLDTEITRARLRRLDDFLAGKRLADGVQLRSDPGEAGEQRALYERCRPWISKGHPVDQDRLALRQNTLGLTREACAPHVLLALDDLVFRNVRNFVEIGGSLSDYGRCLLIARRSNCQRSHTGISAGVYHGTVGDRYPITLVVENVSSGGYVGATYFYNKYASAIRLSGAMTEKGGVQLIEKGPPPARFELRTQPDGRLLGEWTQEGKPPRKVELH